MMCLSFSSFTHLRIARSRLFEQEVQHKDAFSSLPTPVEEKGITDCEVCRTMIRLLFLIRSLEQGGAERQLTELVKGLNRQRFAIKVVTFYDGGALRLELEGIAGVQVLALHKKRRWDLLPFLCRHPLGLGMQLGHPATYKV